MLASRVESVQFVTNMIKQTTWHPDILEPENWVPNCPVPNCHNTKRKHFFVKLFRMDFPTTHYTLKTDKRQILRSSFAHFHFKWICLWKDSPESPLSCLPMKQGKVTGFRSNVRKCLFSVTTATKSSLLPNSSPQVYTTIAVHPSHPDQFLVSN